MERVQNTTTPVTLIFLCICTLITLPGIFSDSYYGLFSGEPPGKYWWNYFMMVFQHGKIGNPAAILVHFGLNMLLLLTVGRWVEILLQSRRFLLLSLTAWTVFILTQWISGIWINGSSGIIWAYSPFLLTIEKLPPDNLIARAKGLARPLMWIMWVVVTIFMTFVPLIFNPAHTLLHAFVYGNLFHLMATLTGFVFYFSWRKQLEHGHLRRG